MSPKGHGGTLASVQHLNWGEESVYGWLKDRFGLSWRIVPKILDDMLKDPDEDKIEAVTATFLKNEEARDRAAATGV